MFYIPKDWLLDPKNESRVHEILQEHLFSDINLKTDTAIEELEKLGEFTLVEKIKYGILSLA